MTVGVYSIRPQEAGARSDWVARPRYALSDFVTLLWRERFVMIAVFLLILAGGIGFAFTMQKTYPTQASVLVRLGQEYVYQPRSGDAGRGAVPDLDQLIQSESEILSSDALRARVIARIGYTRIYPENARRFEAAGQAQRDLMVRQGIAAMGRAMSVGTAPDTAVIRVAYRHKDATIAAQVLNTLLEEYLIYRRSVLIEPNTNAVEQQRRGFERRLADADAAYNSFLATNQIGDFNAEKTSLSQLQAQVEQQLYQAQTQLQERQGRLTALNAQIADVQPEMALFHDVDPQLQNRLTELRVQREGLLSRYRPDAQPVQEIDTQIRQLEQAQAQGRAQGVSGRRVGVNPVYQTLQTDRIQLTAEVSALQASIAQLSRQMEQLTERRLRLAELEPQFTALARERDVLQNNVRDFTVREAESQASAAIAASTNDNIRIVERASTPTQAQSLRQPVAILSLLFAAFTALCAGLLRMFLRPGLPTPAAAARTLDLPVLGAAPAKSAA